MHPEFLYFFQLCQSDLRAYIGSVCRDAHAREDIFQEVSRTLWEKFPEYEMEQSFGAWARGIATHKLQQAKRKDARFPLVFEPATLDAIAAAFDEAELDSPYAEAQEMALSQCLEALPAPARQLLTWRYEERLKCERIGQQLGQNTKAVHQMLCRLRQRLAQCIQGRLATEEI